MSYPGVAASESIALHIARTEVEQIVHLTQELQWSRLKIQALEERLRQEMIRNYGPKSEKLSDAQLLLLELEPGVSAAVVEAESRREPLPPASPISAKNRKSGKHPGRQELPAKLPRVERVIACTPEQCVCKSCGKDTVVIGYEQSEQLDVEPAQYFVVSDSPGDDPAWVLFTGLAPRLIGIYQRDVMVPAGITLNPRLSCAFPTRNGVFTISTGNIPIAR